MQAFNPIQPPVGFRFAPTSEDLVASYLRRKVKGEALPCEGVVIERDIYSAAPWNVLHDQDPWNTCKIKPNKYEHVIYVFTKLKKIGAKRRVIRRAGDCGTWDGRTRVEKIYNEQNEHVGFQKMLNFEADAKNDEGLMLARGHWIMYEYSLGGVSLEGIEDDHDYVVCKIKRDDSKPLKTATKRDRDGDDVVSELSHARDNDHINYPIHKKMKYDHEASTSQSSCASLQKVSIPEHLDSETAFFMNNIDFETEQIVGAYSNYLWSDDFTNDIDFETEQVRAYSEYLLSDEPWVNTNI